MITYRDAGVDIERGDELIDRIVPLAQRTHRPGVLAGIGGFGAMFDLKALQRYQDPVLVTGCDGVGTKLKVAFMADEHKGVGIDLVAMSVNDILCHGAEPLFFLDYYATSKLDVARAAKLIEGISEGCMQAGCALVGGETAELPGFYTAGEYDVAGFAVGIVERSKILPRRDIAEGDVVVGLASSGLHSNGFALARKLVFETLGLGIDDALPQGAGPVKQTLLTPTRIYVAPVLSLLGKVSIKGIAHITGGGLIENVPRVLPAGLRAEINPTAWQIPKLFSVLQAAGGLSGVDMFRTFNMGIGLVLLLSPPDVEPALAHLRAAGEQAAVIGHITQGKGEASCRVLGAD